MLYMTAARLNSSAALVLGKNAYQTHNVADYERASERERESESEIGCINSLWMSKIFEDPALPTLLHPLILHLQRCRE